MLSRTDLFNGMHKAINHHNRFVEIFGQFARLAEQQMTPKQRGFQGLEIGALIDDVYFDAQIAGRTIRFVLATALTASDPIANVLCSVRYLLPDATFADVSSFQFDRGGNASIDDEHGKKCVLNDADCVDVLIQHHVLLALHVAPKFS